MVGLHLDLGNGRKFRKRTMQLATLFALSRKLKYPLGIGQVIYAKPISILHEGWATASEKDNDSKE